MLLDFANDRSDWSDHSYEIDGESRMIESTSNPPDQKRALRPSTILTLVFLVEIVVLWVVQIPDYFRFEYFAFGDQGANLKFHVLMDQGRRPLVDFGYAYGMLSPLMERPWFWLFGKTPAAYFGGGFIATMFMGWGLARFAVAMRVGKIGVAFLIAAMPFTINLPYPMLFAAIEAALITNALAEQAAGRRDHALVLITLAALVKPSMAYCYGFVIISTMLIAERGRPGARFWKSIASAAMIGIGAVAAEVAYFGVYPVLHSFFPTVGAKSYRLNNLGFFHGIGRYFWHPPGARIGYYLGTTAGFWLAATTFFLICAIVSLARTVRPKFAEDPYAHNHEMIVTCAIIHIIFVCLFWPHAWGYAYYYYVLMMGLAAVAPLSRSRGLILALLTPICLLGNYSRTTIILEKYRTTSPRRDVQWLWMAQREYDDWMKARALVRGRYAALLIPQGSLELLFPEFEPTVCSQHDPGWIMPQELERDLRQFNGADFIVRGEKGWAGEFYKHIPEIQTLLDQKYRVLWGGEYAVVLEKIPVKDQTGGAVK